jgi:hypothetical protein
MDTDQYLSLTADLDGIGSVIERAYQELAAKTGLGVTTLRDAALEAAGLTGSATFNTSADEASAVKLISDAGQDLPALAPATFYQRAMASDAEYASAMNDWSATEVDKVAAAHPEIGFTPAAARTPDQPPPATRALAPVLTVLQSLDIERLRGLGVRGGIGTLDDQIALAASRGEELQLSAGEDTVTLARKRHQHGADLAEDDGDHGTEPESQLEIDRVLDEYPELFKQDHDRTGFGGPEAPHGNFRKGLKHSPGGKGQRERTLAR